MLENPLRRKITKKLREAYGRNIYVVHPHGSQYSSGGVPDLLICVYGLFMGFEVKRPEKMDEVTAIQQRNLDEIATAGGVSAAISSFEEAQHLIDEAIRAKWMGEATTTRVI